MSTTMVRQGDVLVLRKTPGQHQMTRLKEVKRDDGRVVLAYGEATGHAHAIHDPNVTMFRDSKESRRFLKIEEDAELKHEEHDTIKLESGWYEVIQQREYVAPEKDGFNFSGPDRLPRTRYVRD